MGTATRARVTLGLVGLALAARLTAAAALGGGLLFVDEASYVDTADRLLAGGGFGERYNRVPAYPVFVAGLRALTPASVLAVRMLQGAVAAAGCPLVVTFTARAFGPAPALVAGLLYALDPLEVVVAGLLYPETIAGLVLTATAVLLFQGARRDRLGASAGAGIGLGALAQLRPVALAAVPVACAWSVAVARGGARRRCRHAAAIVGACVLALAPWTWRNYVIQRSLVPIATAGTQSAPVERVAHRSGGLVAAFVRQAWKAPIPFAAHVGREFAHFFELYPQRMTTDNPEGRAELQANDPRLPLDPPVPRGLRDAVGAVSFGAELVLVLVGLAAAWRTDRQAAMLVAGLVLSHAFGYALFIGKTRYRITVLPLLFSLAGVGAVAIGRVIPRRASAATALRA